MSDTTFETLLTGQLRAYAEAGVRPIDRFAIAEGTIASGRARRIGLRWSVGRGRRPMVLVLVGLLILAFAASAALIGGGLRTGLTDTGSYEAIFLRDSGEAPGRDVDIVAVTPAGGERLVRRLDSSILASGGFATFGSVSQDGWVGVEASLGPSSVKQMREQWMLMDLTRPDRQPRFVPFQPVIGGAWGPNGLFATTREQGPLGSIKVVDGADGSAVSSLDLSLPGSGPSLMWAADGSGLVVATDGGHAIAPLDGGPIVPGVPQLAPHMGARWLAPGGSTVYVCGGGDCTASEDGLVSTIADDGTATQWYDGQIDGAQVRDASFSADGRSVWILLDQVEGANHLALIAKSDEPGEVRVVRTLHLGPSVAHMWFSGLAPDDSVIAIDHWLGEPGDATTQGPTLLVSTTGGDSVMEPGQFIGFMPVGLDRDDEGPTPAPSAEIASPEPSAASEVTTRPASMMVHRNGHTATRLDDGRVLVTGGWSGYPTDDSARAEIYDPLTNTFSPTGTMASRRDGNTATRLTDGSVLVVGGTDASSNAQGSAEVYDPATGRFHPVGSLATPRSGHAAVRLLDGRVAIIGGSNESPSIELYDPLTGTFTPGPTDPRLARAGASAVVLDDGRVLIVGGFDPVTGSGDPATFAAGVLYDPRSGSLTTTAPVRSGSGLISPGRPIGPAIKLADGSVLIAIESAAGQWGLTRFDPAARTFTIVASLDGLPGDREPALLPDGRVFFVLQDPEHCDRIFGAVFAPETGQVTPVEDVPGIGGCNGGPSPTVTALADGSVLVAGGKLSGGESTEHATVIRVDP